MSLPNKIGVIDMENDYKLPIDIRAGIKLAEMTKKPELALKVLNIHFQAKSTKERVIKYGGKLLFWPFVR